MQYTQKELQLGIRLETSHTDDPCLAEKIACSHLREDARYYSKLTNAGLEEDIEIFAMTPEKKQAQLTSSGLGVAGKNKPLTSDQLETPPTKTDTDVNMVYLGRTPQSAASPTIINEPAKDRPYVSQARPNLVPNKRTPKVDGTADALDHFGQQIDSALKDEVPRRMELNPLAVSEGGAQLKKNFTYHDGVKVDGEHAGLTTDMHGRFRIRAFDSRTANKNETPPIK